MYDSLLWSLAQHLTFHHRPKTIEYPWDSFYISPPCYNKCRISACNVTHHAAATDLSMCLLTGERWKCFLFWPLKRICLFWILKPTVIWSAENTRLVFSIAKIQLGMSFLFTFPSRRSTCFLKVRSFNLLSDTRADINQKGNTINGMLKRFLQQYETSEASWFGARALRSFTPDVSHF